MMLALFILLIVGMLAHNIIVGSKLERELDRDMDELIKSLEEKGDA